MKTIEEIIKKEGSIKLSNLDKTNILVISYTEKTNQFTLVHNDKKIKSAKQFKTIVKQLEILNEPEEPVAVVFD